MYLEYFKNPCYEASSWHPSFPSKIQCLPYFHVLGSDKCGTTVFHARLTSHPLILKNDGGLGKETYYWSWLRYGIYSSYEGCGSYARRSQTFCSRWIKWLSLIISKIGDATPMDFWDFRGWQLDPQNEGLPEPRFLTPHAMRHLYKDPRFFLLFRNPIDRLYSDYVFLGYGFTAHKFARDVPIAIDMMRD
ncbi:unnamed protein product [Lymnaea stagnalis]|uniref:Sulfotransferase domain-containing protein n=1 Tax=Lymnaea stagnalis TaxID=6523 RepID=A0AAV2HUX5_LYMST